VFKPGSDRRQPVSNTFTIKNIIENAKSFSVSGAARVGTTKNLLWHCGSRSARLLMPRKNTNLTRHAELALRFRVLRLQRLPVRQLHTYMTYMMRSSRRQLRLPRRSEHRSSPTMKPMMRKQIGSQHLSGGESRRCLWSQQLLRPWKSSRRDSVGGRWRSEPGWVSRLIQTEPTGLNQETLRVVTKGDTHDHTALLAAFHSGSW